MASTADSNQFILLFSDRSLRKDSREYQDALLARRMKDPKLARRAEKKQVDTKLNTKKVRAIKRAGKKKVFDSNLWLEKS